MTQAIKIEKGFFNMKIGHIAAELSPLAKVGGLADVVYGLAEATAKAGHKVCVIIPAYPHLKHTFFSQTQQQLHTVDQLLTYSLSKNKLGSITVYGIELHQPQFKRDSIYGGPDELLFFLYFAKAASHLAQTLQLQIVHGHDWQSALSLFELKKAKSPIRSLLTLHNLQYQGKIEAKELIKLGLNFPLPPWMLDPAQPHLANLLKIGIESADRITTVSKSYHEQILDGLNDFNLQATLLTHRHKFLGLLNGIDFEYFDPFHDKKLAHPYPKKAFKDPEALRLAKEANLKALVEKHQKPFDTRFTLCSITRLTDQKAPFLILHALKKVIETGGRFIMVGSLHGSNHDSQLIEILKTYQDHPYVIVELNTDSTMAHNTYASCHALIVPSLFEPCGLTQMIALRYGTIPLVRATGGLKDTIFDVDTAEVIEEKRNGFTFEYPDEGGVDWVVNRAYKLYQQEPHSFFLLALKNMHEDHSWTQAAQGYLELYTILGLNFKA